MHQLRILGPLALLVSGLMLAVADPAGEVWPMLPALAAGGLLLALALWRDGPALGRSWRGTAAWLQSAARFTPPPARRVTIRIRCAR
ncbi:hypothetical protein [Roseomonas haemaphysalidis]|jgi:hypothetical protein|uniref:DUF4175 domain-containing protein n=1 Tax=Roseomonas haemaphysalidis TaxID=2768162 RepID=A0ABS3KSP2_9PROT|nr:hypothetical protein [Roseomonas haemaphysalidis]MBO1080488.1 hypothetical protein [Roseomonas haemaphysalidis]